MMAQSILPFIFGLFVFMSTTTVISAYEQEDADFIVFMFFAVFIGAGITYLISRYLTELHYTVVIFFLGVIIAVIFNSVYDHDLLKISITQWEGFSGDLIIYIFLPALLFGDSMGLNFHHVKENFLGAVLLAGPGALIGAILTAVFVKYLVPYDWGWSISLLFGAITCATDPVAVVALLKSVGAGINLTYAIAGESLLNDGTALVLYTLFYELVSASGKGDITAEYAVVYLIKVLTISPLIGIGMGFISVASIGLANLKHKEEDTTIQLAITFCCAYFSFYVAQRILMVSGVLACCAAGIILSRYAVPRYLKAETIESVWSAIEWMGNTLLFFLAGLIIGELAVLKVYPIDIAYIIVVYLFLIVLRFATLVLLYPFLVYCGPGCDNWQSLCFIGWGGLRGGVSIALALSFYQSTLKGHTTSSETDAETLMFLVGGIAALTLLINTTTSKWLLMKLHLLEEVDFSDAISTVNDVKKKKNSGNNGGDKQKETKLMFEYLKKRIRLKAYTLIEKAQNHYLSDYLDISFVFSHCSILKNSPEASFVPPGSDQGDDGDEGQGRERNYSIASDDGRGEGGEANKNINADGLSITPRELTRTLSEGKELLSTNEEYGMEPDRSAYYSSHNNDKNNNNDVSNHQHDHRTHSAPPNIILPTPAASNKEELAIQGILKNYQLVPNQKALSRLATQVVMPKLQEDGNSPRPMMQRKKSINYNEFAQGRLRSLSIHQRGGGGGGGVGGELEEYDPTAFANEIAAAGDGAIVNPKRGAFTKFHSVAAFPTTNTIRRQSIDKFTTSNDNELQQQPERERVNRSNSLKPSSQQQLEQQPAAKGSSLSSSSAADVLPSSTISRISPATIPRTTTTTSTTTAHLDPHQQPANHYEYTKITDTITEAPGDEEEESDKKKPLLPPPHHHHHSLEEDRERIKEAIEEEIERPFSQQFIPFEVERPVPPLPPATHKASTNPSKELSGLDLVSPSSSVITFTRGKSNSKIPYSLLLPHEKEALNYQSTNEDKIQPVDITALDLSLSNKQKQLSAKKLPQPQPHPHHTDFPHEFVDGSADVRHIPPSLLLPHEQKQLQDQLPPSPTAATAAAGEGQGQGNGEHKDTIDLGPSKLLSFRLLHNIIYYDLLITMRKVFFEVLRVNYFKQINSGQLPRKSFAAILLLNSTDISLNNLKSSNDKIQDLFILIKSHYYLKQLYQQRNDNQLQTFQKKAEKKEKEEQKKKNGQLIQDDDEQNDAAAENDAEEEDDRTAAFQDGSYSYSVHLQTAVMILIAFIEGHEFAQSRIAFYLGETEGIDTPEEDIVISESNAQVKLAKELLTTIYEPILRYIYSKRILNSILSLQHNLIYEFQIEGIINIKYADLLYEEIQHDVDELIQIERKKIYAQYYRTTFGIKSLPATAATTGTTENKDNHNNDSNKVALARKLSRANSFIHDEDDNLDPNSPSSSIRMENEKEKKISWELNHNLLKFMWVFMEYVSDHYFEEFANWAFFTRDKWHERYQNVSKLFA